MTDEAEEGIQYTDEKKQSRVMPGDFLESFNLDGMIETFAPSSTTLFVIEK